MQSQSSTCPARAPGTHIQRPTLTNESIQTLRNAQGVAKLMDDVGVADLPVVESLACLLNSTARAAARVFARRDAEAHAAAQPASTDIDNYEYARFDSEEAYEYAAVDMAVERHHLVYSGSDLYPDTRSVTLIDFVREYREAYNIIWWEREGVYEPASPPLDGIDLSDHIHASVNRWYPAAGSVEELHAWRERHRATDAAHLYASPHFSPVDILEMRTVKRQSEEEARALEAEWLKDEFVFPGIRSLNGLSFGDEFAHQLSEIQRLLPQLNQCDAAIARAALMRVLSARCGSTREADKLVVAFTATPNGHTVFDDGGRLRAADPRAVRLEQQYLVDEHTPLGEVGEVFADFGMLKTWYLLGLSLSVAFGVPFLGRAVLQRPAIYIAYEGGKRSLWLRVSGWLVEHGMLPREHSRDDLQRVLENRFILAEMPPKFDHPSFETGLKRTLEDLGAGLIVLDTYGKALGAEQKENDADAAHSNVTTLARIIGDDAAAIYARHVGYDGSRGRGSSGQTQDADFAFLFEGSQADAGKGLPVTITPKKRKNDDCWAPHAVRLKPVEVLIDGKAYGTGVIEAAQAERKLPLRARLFLFIQARPGCSRSDWDGSGSGGGVDGNKVEKAREVAALEEMGAITVDRSSQRHKYTATPGWSERNGEVVSAADDFNFEETGNVQKNPNDDLLEAG